MTWRLPEPVHFTVFVIKINGIYFGEWALCLTKALFVCYRGMHHHMSSIRLLRRKNLPWGVLWLNENIQKKKTTVTRKLNLLYSSTVSKNNRIMAEYPDHTHNIITTNITNIIIKTIFFITTTKKNVLNPIHFYRLYKYRYKYKTKHFVKVENYLNSYYIRNIKRIYKYFMIIHDKICCDQWHI